MFPLGEPDRLVGPHIKCLSHAFARKFSEIARSMGADELSIIHGHLLAFLYWKQSIQEDVYQRDIEEAFHITRSSVTGVVKRMEERGYIARQGVAGDARLKKLTLTDQGTEAFLLTRNALDQVENLAVQGLSPQETEVFLNLCRRLEANLSDKKECVHAKAHFIPD